MSNKALTKHASAPITFKVMYQIMRPLAKLLIKQGMTAELAIEAVKCAFVDSVEQDFPIKDKQMSTSRIAVLTGLSRTVVAKLRNKGQQGQDDWDFENRAAKVLNGWVQNKRYHRDGAPSELPFEGELSFSSLVKQYSGGMPPYSVLDELERVGLVKIDASENVTLLNTVYIPELEEDKLKLLAKQTSDLIRTMDRNINHPDDVRVQLVLEFEDISLELSKALQNLTRQQGRDILRSWNEELINIRKEWTEGTISGSMPVKGDHRAGVGIYFYDENKEEL